MAGWLGDDFTDDVEETELLEDDLVLPDAAVSSAVGPVGPVQARGPRTSLTTAA